MTKKAVGNAGKVYKKYTKEFRRDAVRMIETEGLTTAEVGRRLGVNANLLRKLRQHPTIRDFQQPRCVLPRRPYPHHPRLQPCCRPQRPHGDLP